MTFGLIGRRVETDTIQVPGANYAPITDFQVLRAAETVTLTLSSGIADVTGDCWGEFTFNLENGYRGTKCIGHVGNRDVVLGQCSASMGGDIHFTDNTIMDAFLEQTEFSAHLEVLNNNDKFFELMMYRCKFTGEGVTAGGQGEDVVNAIQIGAMYDAANDTTGYAGIA